MWGWGHAEVATATSPWDVTIGGDIDSYIDMISQENSEVYFHNLRFDGMFILSWLMTNGYEYNTSPGPWEFSTLISNMGQFYSIEVRWGNGKRTKFLDSAKKLPMTVKRMAESFNLNVMKGEIDYKKFRAVGHKPTIEERAYIANDVLIVAIALKTQFDAGLTKMTVGSDSLADFKKMMGSKRFAVHFPILPETMDADIRKAYRGGFTYVNPKFQCDPTTHIKVYDVNSLYPSVMYDRLLPYGEPEFFEGVPKPTNAYPLYIVSITFTAKLKKDRIPTIQVKGSWRASGTEYLREIKEPTTLSVTNIDLELWEDQYDLDIMSYNGGWAFMGTTGLFKPFIDKWMEIKMNSTGGLRELAKLQLNSLYGKFATNPDVTGKYPVIDGDEVVRLVQGPDETREPVYTGMGAFITAYARDVTIRAAQENYEIFAYADTDSLHLVTTVTPENLDIDSKALGKWKHEYDGSSGLFIRPKVYIELKMDGEYETHVAGVTPPESVTFDDFYNGNRFPKLTPKRVRGGIVLVDSWFTLTL